MAGKPKFVNFNPEYVRARLMRGATAAEIWRHYGMSKQTFFNYCRRHGISTNPNCWAYKRLDALHIPRFYVEWQIGVDAIVAETGIARRMVQRYLQDRGVRLRTRSEQYRINKRQQRERDIRRKAEGVIDY